VIDDVVELPECVACEHILYTEELYSCYHANKLRINHGTIYLVTELLFIGDQIQGTFSETIIQSDF
jgi:hypothetical protein